MKHNIFIHLVIIVLSSVLFSSCEWIKTSDNPNQKSETNTNIDNDAINQVGLDTEHFQSKEVEVDNKTGSNLKEQKHNIKETNEARNNTWYFFIIVVISILSVIFALISILRITKLKDRLDRHRKDIDKLKNEISDLYITSQQQYSKLQNAVSSTEFKHLSTKVKTIENTVKNNTVNVNNSDLIRNTNVPKEEPKESSRKGYFGTAISGEGGNGYFKRLLDSREDARFEVTVVETSATFEPMAHLNAIKSSDAMDLAIEFEGVSKHDATSMSIRHKGKAQQMGDKWIIINKAVVTLS